ncbi:uncharacterized protein WCC33_004029 [Rhinophrynus dorsalis]
MADMLGKDTEFEDLAEEDTGLNLQIHLLPSQRSEDRHKDHCDYLLDSIDEQLDQLQSRSNFKSSVKYPDEDPKGAKSDMEQPHEIFSQEPKDAISSCSNEQSKDKECKKEEYKWRLSHLLGSEQTDNQEYHSDSNSAESVCTEDFVIKFKQGMIEPIASTGANEDPVLDNAQDINGKPIIPSGDKSGNAGLSIALSECCGGDNFSLNTARREDILQQFKEELEDDLRIAFSLTDEGQITASNRNRRDSVESLGDRISRLSQTNMSEPSSLRSFEKVSSVESYVSSKGLLNQQKCSGSPDKHFIDTQPVCPVNTIGSGDIGRKDLQETKTEIQAADTQSLRVKQGKKGDLFGHKLELRSSGTTACSKGQVEHGSLEHYTEVKRAEEARSPVHPEYLRSHSDSLKASRRNRLEDSQNVYSLSHSIPDKNAAGTCQKVSSKTELMPMDLKDEAHGKSLSRDTEVHFGREEIHTKQDRFALHTKPQSTLESSGTLSLSINDHVKDLSNMDSSMKDNNMTQYKHVAGIPLRSFDAVTVDSDLDTVTTEGVRDHIRKALGSRRGEDPVHNTRRVLCTQTESLRYSGSSKLPTDEDDEEEEFEETFPIKDWRGGSPKRWSSSPLRGTDSTWDHSGKSIHMSSPDHAQRRSVIENLTSERLILEESIAKLRRDISIEEERLSQKRAQHREADQTFNDVLQQKEEAYQELESLRDLLEETQKDLEKMESRVRENQIRSEDFRSEVVLLEYKRNDYLKELQDLELELNLTKQQCSSAHSNQTTNFQYEISTLTCERDELKTRVRHLEGSLSFLERQELERQLSAAKSELFSEQRTARVKIEKLQESLEESQCKLEDKTTECAEIQEKYKQLKSQLRELEKKHETQMQNQVEEASEQKDALSQQVTDLTSQIREQAKKITSLEKILSEKELDLLRMRDVVTSMKSDKEAQALAAETLKGEHSRQVLELQQQHQQDKDLQLAKLREELQGQKQKEIQQFAENMEQVKIKALQDQAESLTKETEKAVRRLEANDKEIAKLKEALRSQKDSMKKLAVELKQEAREMVHNTLLREQKKWESEKRDALQIQRHTMEEERLQGMADLREALEREHRTTMTLEKKAADLQNIIQQHEINNRSLLQEKEEALDDLRTVLKEEKQEEMKRIQQELGEERERDLERLRLRLQQLEEEQHVLRAEKNEAIFREREVLAQAERAERALAREISASCERIQSTPGRPRIHSPSHSRHGSPSRLSTSQALQMLHGVSEETNQYIHELQQEVEAHKRTLLHVQREKERELQQQKEQLQMEKDKALELLKERLIQEHIEEITNLQRDQLRESCGPEGQSLRQQLREKDNELRAIQRNMARWKDETATKLARKFEEELNAELEKSLSRSKASESHRYTERVGPGIRRHSVEGRENSHLRSASTPSLNGVGAPHDFGALKILRNLQGRVRELRADNRMYHGGSMEDLSLLRTDLGNSHLQKRPLMTERSMLQLKGSMRK